MSFFLASCPSRSTRFRYSTRSWRPLGRQLRVTFSRPMPSYCPTCKTELPSGQKFCSKCGKGVEPQGCAKCGAKLELNAKFCGGCGAKVEPPKPADEK